MNLHLDPLRAACGAALLISTLSPAWATEGGGTSKLLGVETVMAGVMPPPGVPRLLMVASHYKTRRSLDGAGQPRAAISNFDLEFVGTAARLQYVWKDFKILGANVESRVGVAWYTHGNISFDLATPAGSRHIEATSDGHGDAIVAPLTLGWHSERLHQIVGVEFFVPTGRFSASATLNKSRGYLAVAPAYRFTWFAQPGVEVSGNLIVLFNRENPDTQVKSGRELSFDYGLGYAIAPGWQLGASGYLYRQISDDTQRGVRVAPDGNRGRVVAIGPFLRWYTNDGMGVTVKWQIESGARNKTDGNRLFLQFARNL